MSKRFISFLMAVMVMIGCTAAPAFAEDAEEPDLHCKAALLVDTKTDQVIYEKNSHKKIGRAHV